MKNAVIFHETLQSHQGLMFDRLGGTQIIKNEGHFGSTTFNQLYPYFPLLLAVIGNELT